MKTRRRRPRLHGLYERVKARAIRELHQTIASLPELRGLVASSTQKVHVPIDYDVDFETLVKTAAQHRLQMPIKFAWTANGPEVGEPDVVFLALTKYVSNGPPKRVKIRLFGVYWWCTSVLYVRRAVAYMRATPPNKWLKQPLLPLGDSRVAMLANTTISKRYLEKFENKAARDWCVSWLIPRLQSAFESEQTSTFGRAKARQMHFIVGSPPNWPVKEPNWSTDATDNYVNWARLNATTIMRDWNVYDVNAFYELETNTVVVPNAFLGFYVEGDDAANMATLGTSIGHEMAHAFDHDGVYYGPDGALLRRPWVHLPRRGPLCASAQKDELEADRVGVELALQIVAKEGLDEARFREVYAAHWPARRRRGDVHASGVKRTRSAFRKEK